MKRAAFTIVELLMVVAIISVLITIVTVSAKGSIQAARSKKASAIVAMVQQAVDVYHAQKGKWPIDNLASRSGRHSMPQDEIEDGGQDDAVSDYLTPQEVRSVMVKLVEETKNGNPMLDLAGLFVSRSTGENTYKPGMDFLTAIHGSRTNRKKMKLSEMYFGFPESSHGLFVRLRMKYSREADRLEVYSD